MHHVDIFCPDAFLRSVFYINPATFQGDVQVAHEGGLTFTIFEVNCRNESEICHNLHAVADADYEFVGLDEFEKVILQIIADFVGESVAGAGVVAVGKASRESDDLVVGEFF